MAVISSRKNSIYTLTTRPSLARSTSSAGTAAMATDANNCTQNWRSIPSTGTFCGRFILTRSSSCPPFSTARGRKPRLNASATSDSYSANTPGSLTRTPTDFKTQDCQFFRRSLPLIKEQEVRTSLLPLLPALSVCAEHENLSGSLSELLRRLFSWYSPLQYLRRQLYMK